MRILLLTCPYVLYIAMMLPGQAAAFGTVVLSDSQDHYSLGKSLEYLVDPGGELSIEQVSSPAYTSEFKISQSAQPNFGFTRNVYWIRLRLKNESAYIDQWYLQQGFANTHYLDLYLPTADEGKFAVTKSGTLRPLASRSIESHLLTFQIPIVSGSEKTIYVRVQNGTAVTLDFNLYSPKALMLHSNDAALWMGVFFGILIAMLCYSLILYFTLRENTYIYLLGFISTAIAIFGFYDGYAQMLFGEYSRSQNIYALPFFVGLHFLALIGFSRSFFDFGRLSVKYGPIYKASTFVWFVYFPMIFILPDPLVRIFMIIFALSTVTLVMVTSVQSLRRNHKSSRYFVISWSVYSVALILMSITTLNIIENSQFTELLFHIGIVWQILFMSMALADRINQLKEEAGLASNAQTNSEKQLGLAMQASRLGTWYWDMCENVIHWSEQTENIFGLEKGQFDGTLESYKSFIHPDDVEVFERSVQQSIENNYPYFVEHRIIRGDNAIRWVAAYGEVQRDSDGQLIGIMGSSQDIGVRKQYEEEYVRSEKKYTAIFQNANDAIVLLEDGVFVDGNAAALGLFGCDRSELFGRSLLDFSPKYQPNGEASADLIARKFEEISKNERRSFEWSHIKSDGTPFFSEINLNNVELGNFSYVQAIIRDVTERKRFEHAIKNIALGVSARIGDKFFHALVEHLARLFDAEYAFVGLLDEEKEKVISTYAVYAHGEITKNISYALASTPCENVIGQKICVYSTGAQQFFPDDKMLVQMGVDSYIGAPLFDHQGEAMGVLVVMDGKPMNVPAQAENILQIFAARASAEMERLRTDQRLRGAEKRLSLHIKQTPLGVIEWDTEYQVTAWNAAAEKIFGYSEDEVLGRHATDLIIPLSIIPTVNEVWQQLLKNKGGDRCTSKNLTKSNKLIFCEWYNTPLVDDAGKVIGVASLVSDITEQVSDKEVLERQRDSLEEMVAETTVELRAANKELETFSYSVSHDLRTPLRTICGFSEVLMEDYAEVLDSKGLDYLERLRSASLQVDGLIKDILSLSRVNRHKMKYESVSLSLLVKDILEKYQLRDKDRKAIIKIEADLKVWCDAHIMRIALENMLNNSWKFTRNNECTEISFGVEKKSGEMIYYIHDNGVGFDMRYAEILFDPFRRLNGQDEFEGSGVGLATVKRTIVRHGGDIWAVSESNKGATFYFTLPRRIAQAGKHNGNMTPVT